MADSAGNFIKYHGYTIICKVADDILSPLEKFINGCLVLRKYVVPTPSSSYHMTITGLDVEDIEILQRLERACHASSDQIFVAVKDVYFGGTLGILLEVSPKIPFLRNRLREIAGMKKEPYHFHITFGYRFRDINPGDYDDYAKDVTSIKKFIYSKFPTTEITIQLKKAVLCEFQDMKEFIEIQIIK